MKESPTKPIKEGSKLYNKLMNRFLLDMLFGGEITLDVEGPMTIVLPPKIKEKQKKECRQPHRE